ncbi:MAG: hypothetical protein AAFV53_11620 [Myxococcota bacterium]
MIEIFSVYLVLGILAAMAEGDWRLSAMARTTMIWPSRVPRLLRQDPSPPDPPGLTLWRTRIHAALESLQGAIDNHELLGDASTERQLLVDTQTELETVAERHAELEAVLARPENNLRVVQAELVDAPEHRQTALVRRRDHVERLYAAREALETQMEAGLAEVMNLAARLHLARATGAPMQSVEARLKDISDVIEGVQEAEDVLGVDLRAPDGWAAPDPAPQPEIIDAEIIEPTPVKEPATRAEKEAFEEVFSDMDADRLPATVRAGGRAAGADGPQTPRQSRWALAGVTLALALGSILVRILYGGGLEQSAALFIGLPAFMAAIVALLPPARTYTGTMLKVITMMLLLSGVFLAEGMICILMAAPLFYMVGITAGVVLDMLRSRKPATRALVLTPLILLSVEGVIPSLSAPRSEVVTVERVVAGTPAMVEASLARRPDFSTQLPIYLRMGFPRPVRAIGEGLDVGDRRSVHFAGGEGAPGDLLLEVWSRSPERVVFGAVSDTSHVAHWLTWRSAEVEWQPVDAERTRVRWTFRYDRDLDPMLWFKPMERYAVWLTAEYLLDCLLPPAAEMDDVAT